jgi:hypothetical protein
MWDIDSNPFLPNNLEALQKKKKKIHQRHRANNKKYETQATYDGSLSEVNEQSL